LASANAFGDVVDMAGGTHEGNKWANGYGKFCNGFGDWANNIWCFYSAGPAGNHIDGFLQIGGGSNPCPAGAADRLTSICFDTATNRLAWSNNNGALFDGTQTIGTGRVLTAGSTIGARSCQAQPSITVVGAQASDSVLANVG